MFLSFWFIPSAPHPPWSLTRGCDREVPLRAFQGYRIYSGFWKRKLDVPSRSLLALAEQDFILVDTDFLKFYGFCHEIANVLWQKDELGCLIPAILVL